MASKFRKTITLPNGVRKQIYASTAAELEEKVLEAKIQIRAGVDLSKDMNFEQFIRLWYKLNKLPNIKQKTREYYDNVIDNHLVPALGKLPLRQIKPMHVTAALAGMSELSASLNAQALQILRAVFDSAVDNNLIARSPVPRGQKPGGQPAKKVRALSREQTDRLLKALDDTRVYLFVWLALKTGMRRGELLGLKWDCVDLDQAVLHVRRNLVFSDAGETLNDYGKTDASIRDLPIDPVTVSALRAERDRTKSIFVFSKLDGTMLTKSAFRSMWSAVERRGFDVTPHQLRHTFCTRCFEAGLDVKEVQYLAGHANPDITMRVYIDYCKEQRQAETFAKVRTMA